MHDNKNKYTFRKHKAYGLVGAMFATALMATPGALEQVPGIGKFLIVESSTVQASTINFSLTEDGYPKYTAQDTGIDGKYRITGDPYGSGTFDAGDPTLTPPSKPVYIGNLNGHNSEIREDLPYSTLYKKDITREQGSENLTEVDGVNGSVVKEYAKTKGVASYARDFSKGIWFVYVDEATLEANRDRLVEKSRVEPTNKVVKVAAKDKVETFQRGRQTVEKTHK